MGHAAIVDAVRRPGMGMPVQDNARFGQGVVGRRSVEFRNPFTAAQALRRRVDDGAASGRVALPLADQGERRAAAHALVHSSAS